MSTRRWHTLGCLSAIAGVTAAAVLAWPAVKAVVEWWVEFSGIFGA